jgi:glycine dehydrogenase subunit 1
VTHRFLPNTDEDIRRMLDAIGVKTVDELFAPVPERVRLKRELAIPPAMSESDLLAHLESLAGQNLDPSRGSVFLGAGVYRHAAPSFIDQMLLRSEFYTAYRRKGDSGTPGRLRVQALVCQLLGADIANASM